MLLSMKWKNKICIGTAQFSGSYGITNKQKKKFKKNDLKKIFIKLKKEKIRFLDTSLTYKTAEKNIFLSKIDTSKFQIITKIPKPDSKKDYVKRIINQIIISKNNFKVNKFHSILLHDCSNIKKNEIDQVHRLFKYLKKKKFTKYIGLSIYNPKEFYKISKYFKPDILQVPINIFDRTFLDKKFLQIIKVKRIKLHVRSIFLQGIILSSNEFFYKKFKNWSNIFQMWEIFCQKNKLSKLEAAANFILNLKVLDKIIVGFYNKKELDQFLSIKRKHLKIPEFIGKNKKDIEKLIKPYYWN